MTTAPGRIAQVRDLFLGPRHPTKYADIFERLLRGAPAARRAGARTR